MKTDLDLKQILQLTDKDIKTVTATLFYMFKIFQITTWFKFLEIKTTTLEMKNVLDFY